MKPVATWWHQRTSKGLELDAWSVSPLIILKNNIGFLNLFFSKRMLSSYSSFQLKGSQSCCLLTHHGRQLTMAQALKSLPPTGETHEAFLAPGSGC